MHDSVYSSYLFRDIPHGQISKILSYFEKIKIKKGQALYSPKEVVIYLYLVLNGEFRIEVREGNKSLILGYSGPSEIIGETSLLAGEKFRTGKVTAILDSEVLRIHKEHLEFLFLKYPKLIFNLGFIQAQRLQKNINVKGSQMPIRRFITHFSAFNELESHYIGLNLAVTIASSLAKPVAYLHLSNCKETPVKTLNCKIEKPNKKLLINKMRKYKQFNVEELFEKHESGVSFLPCIENKLPIEYLNTADIPKLLGFLSKKYAIIFMELGSEELRNNKVIEILKQSDQIIAGLTVYKKSVTRFQKDYQYFISKIPELEKKTAIYQNLILIEEKIKKFSTNVYKKRIFYGELEKVLNHRIDFKIYGRLNNIKEYVPFFLKDINNQALQSLNSLGRWLANRNVGLALGGGGARAMAEIGVLRVLERENIQIDSIVGTSMGALIGAFYAIGKNSYEIETIFAKLLPKDSVIMDYNLPFISFFRGRKMNRLLRKALGRTRFEDLSVPFTCVAVDLLSGKEVRIKKGFLWRAVGASMSLPVLFPPVKYRKYYLADGGILNNVAGDILREEQIHKVIGINCTPFEDDSLVNYIKNNNLFEFLNFRHKLFRNIFKFFTKWRPFIKRPPLLQVANRSMMLEGAELVKSKTANFDILLNPDVRSFSLFDFHERKAIIQKGIEEAEKQIDAIKKTLHV
ncbi:MAG: patatin-like phospholipase family protein [Spirochaetia bacterium]|nr:patatin-like phospholipase family protein [Spirochaetia bacterium]